MFFSLFEVIRATDERGCTLTGASQFNSLTFFVDHFLWTHRIIVRQCYQCEASRALKKYILLRLLFGHFAFIGHLTVQLF